MGISNNNTDNVTSQEGAKPRPTTSPRALKIPILVALGLTLLCLLGLGLMAFLVPPAITEAGISVFQRNFSSACNFGWQAGLGALIGLIGGKSATS